MRAQADEDLLLPEDRPKKPTQKYENKLDKKTSLLFGVGVHIYSANERLNTFGQPQNVLGGFGPGPILQAGVLYHFKPELIFGPDLQFGYFTKPNYQKIPIDLGLGIRYFPLEHSDYPLLRKLHPYGYAGLYATWIQLNQKEHTEVYVPDADANTISFGTPLAYENRYATRGYVIGPSPRFKAGLGIAYTIDRKYAIFLQAGIQPALLDRNTLSEEYPRQRGAHNALAVQTGVSIRLMRDKPPVYDSNLVNVPDLIVYLDVDEGRLKQNLLVRENSFDVILREGVAHHLQVDVKDHEILVEEYLDPKCTVTCYLYDLNGNIIARSESTPEGKVVFSNLEKGIYDVAFVLEKPCKEQNFSYSITDPHDEIVMQYYADFISDENLIYTYTGKIILPDTANLNFIYRQSVLFLNSTLKKSHHNYDVKVFLANQDGKIEELFSPASDLSFQFKNKSSNRHIVLYKIPDAEPFSGIDYQVKDQYLTPIQHVLNDDFSDTVRIRRQTEESKYEQMKYVCKGKVQIPNADVAMSDVTLYLANQKNKIIASQKPDANGNFTFKNLRSKYHYKVYYHIPDTEKNILLNYSFEEPATNDPQNAQFIRFRIPDLPAGEDYISTYDVKGRLLIPKGYSVLVGAFENFENVQLLCNKLGQEGFSDILIQVCWSINLNKRFLFYRNFKLYRVLVGDCKKEKEVDALLKRLEDTGFDGVVIRHHQQQ